MIDTKLRKNFQPIFNKIASIFAKLEIHPDTITIIALLLGILASIMIVIDKTILFLIFLWLSGLMDVIDGTVARMTNKSSKKVAYMDLIFDRMVEASIILGFYFLLPQNTLAYLLFFVSVLFNFTTFMVAGALFKNDGPKSMHYDVGIAERTETFIVFSLLIIFQKYIFIILILFDLIIFMTGIIRFYRIMKYVD